MMITDDVKFQILFSFSVSDQTSISYTSLWIMKTEEIIKAYSASQS